MKKSQITVGGCYLMKVSGKVVTVRVDRILNQTDYKGRSKTTYACTNLSTGRSCRAESAQKFRCEASPKRKPMINEPVDADGRPTSPASAPAPSAESSEEHALPFADQTPPTAPPCSPTSPSATPTTESSSCSTSGEEAKEDEQRGPFAASTNGSEFMPTITEPSKPDASDAVSEASGDGASSRPSRTPRHSGSVSPLSAALASTRGKVAGYTPTEEQRAILDAAVQDGLKALVIAAGAGAGKTSTLKMLEATLPGLGQYTAFNKSLVEESKPKFVCASCNTTHSLAFKAVGRRYAHRLNSNRMRSHEIAQRLGIADFEVPMGTDDKGETVYKRLPAKFLAGQVTMAVTRFCQSADREVSVRHFAYIDGIDMPSPSGRTHENNQLVKEYLLPFAQAMWADANDPNGTLPYKHDYYVKSWQLGTGEDRPHIAADYILLDEAQDSAGVFLDILQQQTHALLVMVGDDCQAIYGWRGAVNAMRAFPGAPRKMLSQSFRFGQAIADVANAVLADLDEPTDLVMRGLESIPSRVAPLDNPTCILCRTNAAAISTGLRVSAEGKKVHLIGGGAETVKWVRAAADLIAGRRTEHPDLACFESWTEVQEYSKTDEGGELKLMVKLVDEFTSEAILAWLEAMPAERDADLVVSTAHKSKGREWSTVKLASDFLPWNKMDDAERRLLYVAATRAKHQLDISECPPFCGEQQKSYGTDSGDNVDGSAWVPGIPIKYTKPMPSPEQLRDWLAAKAEERSAAQPQPTQERTFAPAPSPSSPKAVAPNGTAPDGFTWSKWDGMWCVRGPAGQEGKTVTVVRRNGSTSQERLGTAVQRFAEAWMYRTLG